LPSIPNALAIADMRMLGNAEPLEDYPGKARARWKCRCNRCNRVIYPNRNNVMNGQGACLYCARNAPVDAKAASARMLARGFRTLVDFPGTGEPWPSRCTATDHLVGPRYDNVTGRSGGCRFCKRRGPGDPVEALADMRAAALEPLVPYPGSTGKPWLCLCTRCGGTPSPRLNNVRNRGECCQFCARYGLDPAAPARLYVLQHLMLGAVKIGITGVNAREDRVARFGRAGWLMVREKLFGTGREAYRVEQIVLKQLRDRKGLKYFLTVAEMPNGGWTETFDNKRITAVRLWEMAEEAINMISS
jgi:hypothetical protein